jgi:hypothetical protein
MDRKRIKELIKVIAAVPDEKFDQNEWPLNPNQIRVQGTCGCAGHHFEKYLKAAFEDMTFWGMVQPTSKLQAVRIYFDLTSAEVNYIFGYSADIYHTAKRMGWPSPNEHEVPNKTNAIERIQWLLSRSKKKVA